MAFLSVEAFTRYVAHCLTFGFEASSCWMERNGFNVSRLYHACGDMLVVGQVVDCCYSGTTVSTGVC